MNSDIDLNCQTINNNFTTMPSIMSSNPSVIRNIMWIIGSRQPIAPHTYRTPAKPMRYWVYTLTLVLAFDAYLIMRISFSFADKYYMFIWDRYVTIVFRWVRGLSGAPDVPQSQVINANRVSSISLSDCSVLAKYKAAPSIGELTKQSRQQAIKLTLNIQLLDKHLVEWEAIIWKENLLIHIPNGISLDNSKEAFISLLELAEEELQCQSVTVYFDKKRTDRNSLMRLFSFIGFSLLAPNSMSADESSEDMLYMAYSISG